MAGFSPEGASQHWPSGDFKGFFVFKTSMAPARRFPPLRGSLATSLLTTLLLPFQVL